VVKLPEVTGDFEALRNKILADAFSRYDEVIDNSLADAKSVLAKVYAQLVDQLERKKKEVDVKASSLKKSSASRALIEARDLVLSARDEARRSLRDLIMTSLSSIPASPSYAALISSLLEKAVSALGAKELKVYANQRDFALIKREASAIGVSVTLKKYDCVGGLRAETADGSASFDATLEQLVDRVLTAKRDEVERALFGDRFAHIQGKWGGG